MAALEEGAGARVGEAEVAEFFAEGGFFEERVG